MEEILKTLLESLRELNQKLSEIDEELQGTQSELKGFEDSYAREIKTIQESIEYLNVQIYETIKKEISKIPQPKEFDLNQIKPLLDERFKELTQQRELETSKIKQQIVELVSDIEVPQDGTNGVDGKDAKALDYGKVQADLYLWLDSNKESFKGDTGERGINGLNGRDGLDGISIVDVTIKNNVMTIHFSDDTIKNIKLPKQKVIMGGGSVGDSGYKHGTKTIVCSSKEDFGECVNGEILLKGGYSYLYNEDIDFGDCHIRIPDGERILIQDEAHGTNTLSFSCEGAAFVCDDLLNFAIFATLIDLSANTDFLDLTSLTVPGICAFDDFAVNGGKSLGTTTNISHAWMRLTITGFLQGLSAYGGVLCAINYGAYFTPYNATVFKLYGTWTGTVTFLQAEISMGAGGYAFCIDPAYTAPITRLQVYGVFGGTMFCPTGKNGTTPGIKVRDIVGIKDSDTIGFMYIANNETYTTIDTADTWTEVLGVSVAPAINERFTHTTTPSKLTYIGFEDINGKIDGSVVLRKSGNELLYEIGIFYNEELNPQFAFAVLVASNKPTILSSPWVMALSINDSFRLKVKAIGHTDNLLVENMALRCIG